MSNVSGISFDAENTLLVYNNHADGDAGCYLRAVDVYNAQEGVSLFHPAPSWLGDSIQQHRVFNSAWSKAHASMADRLRTPDTADLWDKHWKAPWGCGRDAADDFYQLVCDNYFESPCPPQFVQFLVHHYYVSEAVYRLPDNVHQLVRIKQQYPHLSMVVVSNTDERVARVLHLFPVYRELFGLDAIFSATTLPELKPSPLAISHAIAACHVGQDKVSHWLHVGDSMREDGGSAKAAGCHFLHCDAAIGVDFEKLAEVIERGFD